MYLSKKLGVVVIITGLVASFSTAQAVTVLLVSDNAFINSRAGPGDPEVDMEAFMTSLGYDVIRATGSGSTAQFREGNDGAAGAAAVGADLIVVSRVTTSGAYDEGNNGANWNAITTPLLLLGPHIARSSRWKWLNSTIVDQGAVTDLVLDDPTHPFVSGLGTSLFDSSTSLTRLDTTNVGNGGLIATAPDGDVALVEWDAGDEFYSGSGQIAGGQRVYFGGLRYHEDDGARQLVFDDYSDNGMAMLGQIMTTMVPIPEPSTIAILGSLLVAAPFVLWRRRKPAG